MKALVFGCGYLGAAFARRLSAEDWTIAATARDPEKREALAARGLQPVDPADADALAAAAGEARAVLVTAPPDEDGCPGLRALAPALAHTAASPDWIGYVSTTAAYGDRDGGWVFEHSELNAASVPGARRTAAERDWARAAQDLALTLCIFRLPAIYGPGRSPFAKLRDGTARLVRKPGQVFNRVHVDDAVSGMRASLARPRAGAAYNLCDDEPAGADVYTEFAAGLLGLPPPPEAAWTDPGVGEAMRRFYLDNKRVSNALAKAELGWRPKYPDWRDGLRAVLTAEG